MHKTRQLIKKAEDQGDQVDQVDQVDQRDQVLLTEVFASFP